MTPDPFPPTLIESVRDHASVAFIGAGLSIGSGGLSWSALCRRLLDEIRVELGHENVVQEVRGILAARGKAALGDAVESFALSSYDPLMIAQMFQERCGRPRIVQLLQHMCSRMTGPTTAHHIIAQLGFDIVVTTNYDDLIEQALSATGRRHAVVVREEDAAYWNIAETKVIKMHGSLVNPFDADSVVIAREDFEAYSERRPNMDLLIRFLMTTRNLLLIGYSARDPNFLALHDRVRLALKRHKNQAFFVVFDMPVAMQDYWRSYGFYPIVLTGPNKAALLEAWLTELKKRL